MTQVENEAAQREIEEKISLIELQMELDRIKYLLKLILESNNALNKPVVTTKEAAYILGLKPRTLRMYNDTMKLPGYRYTKNGPLFFKLASILKYQDDNLRHSAYFKD